MSAELRCVYGKNYRTGNYYGKAIVISDKDHNIYLKSYDTVVCGIVNGWVRRYWDGYSVTTMGHINDFLMQQGHPKMSKKDWINIPVSGSPKLA